MQYGGTYAKDCIVKIEGSEVTHRRAK